MNIRSAAPAALLLVLAGGCGGKTTQAKSADDLATTDTSSADAAEPTGTAPAPGAGDDATGKSGNNPCTGFELDLMEALIRSACEVPNVKHDVKAQEVKDKVVVTALVPTATVAPGAHSDIIVTIKNKTAMPLSLDFLVDPLPRFSIETYSTKGSKQRVDLPIGNEPKIPDGMEPRGPGEAKTARITLAANGAATVKVPWDASKMRWAPEKLRGSAPELGYPKVPAGPLPKGKYDLRVVTPLINVFEGMDKEISSPRTTVEVK
jgi:hypothetical protein